MNQREAQRLITVIRELADQPSAPLPAPAVPRRKDEAPLSAGEEAVVIRADEREALYQSFKARFIDEARTDPVLLQLMANQPEIVVEIQPRVVVLDGTSLKGRLARLVAAGWFGCIERTQSATRTELRRTGSDVNSGNLSVAFSDFVREGFLTRSGEAFVAAPGLKVSERRLEA